MLANTHTRVFLGLTAFACFIGLQVAHGETGKDILRATGFRGGLVGAYWLRRWQDDGLASRQ